MIMKMKSFALKMCRNSRNKTFFVLLFATVLYLMYLSNIMIFINGRIYNPVVEGGYLILNPKCHMLSKDPFDPSIKKFVKKEKYENCSNLPLLTSINQDIKGQNVLTLKTNETKNFKSIHCCWSQIVRPIPKKPKPEKDFDSSFKVENCIDFNRSIILPKDVEILMVTCEIATDAKKPKTIYKNVHSVINVEKVLDRFKVINHGNVTNEQKKLSVLLLGIDNVSRLNFYRNLPKTVDYLDKNGWLHMKSYNKIGESTFPNLMAILTGQNEMDAKENCNSSVPFGLDNCPMLWYNFRNAGYVTAYAEDESFYSTFNWLKVGFVDPPTDYYLRPYIMATEKLLKTRIRNNNNLYCTGPELATERILNSAADFAIRFQGRPYFGFFWTNSLTHTTFINNLSIMDSEILSRLEHLEREGVLSDTMIIFLSDHGMRFGEFRNTFMGWYEERLPFFYVWLPKWFRDENPKAYQALTVNQNRLTSTFDVYETLRDILITARGNAGPSTGCPKCRSLFKEVPKVRGCEEAGISSHWCTCTSFEKDDSLSPVAVQGARKILEHIENIIQGYKTTKGERLCSKLKLKEIQSFYKVSSFDENQTSNTKYFYMIQVSPGNAKFEVTVNYYGSNNYSIKDEEIARIDQYGTSSKCLKHSQKRYCHCIKQ